MDDETRLFLESLTEEELELGKQLLSVHRSVRRRLKSAYGIADPAETQKRAEDIMRIVCANIAMGQSTQLTEPVEHVDLANALYLSCVRNNSPLEDLHCKYISDAEMEELNKTCVANVADWLIVTTALSKQPALFEAYIRGALVWGATSWERDRSQLVSTLFEDCGPETE